MIILIFSFYLISGILSRGTSLLHNLLNKKGVVTLHGLIHSLSILTLILMDPPSVWAHGILALLYLDVAFSLFSMATNRISRGSQRWISAIYSFLYVVSLFFVGAVQVGIIKLDAL
jgi:hypothetical protein